MPRLYTNREFYRWTTQPDSVSTIRGSTIGTSRWLRARLNSSVADSPVAIVSSTDRVA